MRLVENEIKDFLRRRGLPVPPGEAAASPAAAGDIAARLGGAVAVKALVAAGRRGKAGAVRLAADAAATAHAAKAMLGRDIAGLPVERVYVEQQVAIARELYLAFTFGPLQPRVMASRHGGVDIEETLARDPHAAATRDIDPRLGLRPWEAVALWQQAGIESALLPRLAEITVAAYAAFCAADALMVEVNPLALAQDGTAQIVGAMAEIDDNSLFRHPEWADERAGTDGRGHALSERERAVIAADRAFPGGAVRYSELDGDIGLMVAGGGAGLLQHDLVLAAGGRPANHSDVSPGPTPDKSAALIEAILRNPRVRGLLISYNYLQMARCDNVIRALSLALERHPVDHARFPIVVRLFGPGEAEARALAAEIPGLTYMPYGASLAEAVAAIVAATRSPC